MDKYCTTGKRKQSNWRVWSREMTSGFFLNFVPRLMMEVLIYYFLHTGSEALLLESVLVSATNTYFPFTGICQLFLTFGSNILIICNTAHRLGYCMDDLYNNVIARILIVVEGKLDHKCPWIFFVKTGLFLLVNKVLSTENVRRVVIWIIYC